jgi:DNA-binding MurR/RpiR family transcriptional regulator
MTKASDENTTSSNLAARTAVLSSPIERSVADVLLAAGPRAGAMSAREVAQAVGTSDATVIRTSRSLGFEGYRDLRRFVAGQATEVPIEERLRKSLDAVEDPGDELRAAIERQGGDLTAMARPGSTHLVERGRTLGISRRVRGLPLPAPGQRVRVVDPRGI